MHSGHDGAAVGSDVGVEVVGSDVGVEVVGASVVGVKVAVVGDSVGACDVGVEVGEAVGDSVGVCDVGIQVGVVGVDVISGRLTLTNSVLVVPVVLWPPLENASRPMQAMPPDASMAQVISSNSANPTTCLGALKVTAVR
jgi:hypothetical protein